MSNPTVRTRLRAHLLRAASWLRGEVKDFLEPYGLTQPQFNILRILRGNLPTPLSTQAIRERMIDPSSDASRLVDRLVAKGLVEKTPCCDDRRLVDVAITSDGLALLARVDAAAPSLDDILDVLDDDEAARLDALLATLLERAQPDAQDPIRSNALDDSK